MPRTSEEPIEIDETYRGILKTAVAAAGGQEAVAELIKVNQSTISRTLKEGGRATYTTLMKLSRCLAGVPAPVIPVRDREHARWCRLGALLEERHPDQFRQVLQNAAAKAKLVGFSDDEWSGDPPPKPTPEAMSALKSVITHPLRTDRKRDVTRR